ncbi:hypothetical protein [Thermosipho globiformans]|uniref:aspartate-alanine antiporter-like transporter n=1 Tax=Thermosipho globiformans TaxID=380685 RepID=UPI000F8EE200|nr:hypothetical protein [Thermosipho globiformans]
MSNPFFLLFISILNGLLLGKIQFKNFKLGTSGTLFAGLFFGWMFPLFTNSQKELINIQNSLNTFFNFSLILFVSSIGLIASSDIKKILKTHGFKFIILGFLITFSGFISTLLFTYITNLNNLNLLGVFSGSMTSSPGLASALESIKEGSTDIIYGYTVGYIPGVLAVIFSIYFIPIIFKININEEKKSYKIESIANSKDSNFNFISFSIVIILGILIGNLNLNLKFASLKLGNTGGILLSSLFLGSLGKIGNLSFEFNKNILKVFQNLGLVIFLSSIGLRSGYKVISNFNRESLYLMVISFVCAIFSILVGYIIGKYIFKLDWIILAGAITGGMTSTPGLGAALDSTKSELVTAGYGATYPFALLGMVIFNKLFSILTNL